MPLIYGYDETISESEWKNSDIITRQELLTKYAITNNINKTIGYNKTNKNIETEIVDLNNCITSNKITVNKEATEVEINTIIICEFTFDFY